MNVICSICSELMYESENIRGTRCGHMFHHQCLSQWIARSQTCPQCRNTVTNNSTHRIYPTTTNSEAFMTSAFTLLNEIPSMVDIRLHRTLIETIQSLKRDLQNRMEENEVLKKNIEDSGVKIQAQMRDLEKLREENEVLKKTIENYGQKIQAQKHDIQKLKEANEILKKTIEDCGKSHNQDIQKLKGVIELLETNFELRGRGVLKCHKCIRTFRAKLDFLNHLRAHKRAEQQAALQRAARN